MAKKLRYRCDYCGKKVVFGEHLCNRRTLMPRDPDADLREDAAGLPLRGSGRGGGDSDPGRIHRRNTLRYMIGTAALSLAVLAFVWSTAGVWSLLVLALVPLVILVRQVAAAVARRKNSPFRRFHS